MVRQGWGLLGLYSWHLSSDELSLVLSAESLDVRGPAAGYSSACKQSRDVSCIAAQHVPAVIYPELRDMALAMGGLLLKRAVQIAHTLTHTTSVAEGMS